MKTLIVSTDFSKEAENAMEYAALMAKKMQSKVILFNSFIIPFHAANSILPASAFQEMIDHNRHILKARALKLSETYAIEVGYEAGLMDLSKELDELIARHNAGLVVMGMAAKSIEQDLFGNSTTSAMLKLKYPVLAIPYGVKFDGIKKILFACDELHDRTVLNKIKDLVMALEAELEIFHVGKHMDRLNEEAGTIASDAVIEEVLENVPHYYKSIASGRVIEEIELEILKIHADLLIMVPHKYGFLESILHRSKTRIMASRNSVALLSIPVLPDVLPDK